MMAANNIKVGLIASLILLGSVTVDGAYAGFLGRPGPSQKQDEAAPAPDTPEAQAAAQRVERAKSNLDQAHKQLDAARAVLKAADAEFKAARADQDALSLRTQAQRLADSSGLTGVPMDRVQSIPPVPKGTAPTSASNVADPKTTAASAGTDPKSAAALSGQEERIDPPSDSSAAQDLDSTSSAPIPNAAPLRTTAPQ
jgi:hypothetical protein